MKKHLLIIRLQRVERLTKYAMADKNTLKIRQGFHLIKKLNEEIASLSTPTLCFA